MGSKKIKKRPLQRKYIQYLQGNIFNLNLISSTIVTKAVIIPNNIV